MDFPVEFYGLFPSLAVRREGRGEWSSACPKCGGRDRFRLFAPTGNGSPRYWCRVCNWRGFADKGITPEERERLREERRQRREAERLARLAKTRELTEAAYWRGYHDGMAAAARGLWSARGLPAEAQDVLDLGYGEHAGSPALTIPWHGMSWDVETVQYRLLQPGAGGKYRFESGYPPVGYWTAPDTGEWPVILAEGAIKAAVLWWLMCVQGNWRYNVVGLASKTPGGAALEELAETVGDRETFVLLDPDATGKERRRVGAHFAGARHVTLPEKVDDALLAGWLTPEAIGRVYLPQATEEPL
jgi:hypothetical protein